MKIFVDTSAILAVLNSHDQYHPAAVAAWSDILSKPNHLYLNNYILLELLAILQHRFGIDAVRIFQNDILPVMTVIWIDQPMHEQAVNAMLISNQRDISLVDCVSFECMWRMDIRRVFTFDAHFSKQGFERIPA